MDTKSKKSKPFAAWLSFFVAVNLLLVVLLTSITAAIGFSIDVSAPFKSYRSTSFFKERTGNYFNMLYALVAYETDPNREMTRQQLNNEGKNLIYWADKGLISTNMKGEMSFNASGMPILPPNYTYFWYYDGRKVWVVNDGHPIDTERLDSGYPHIIHNLTIFRDPASKPCDSKLVLAVRDTIAENPYARSMYYWEHQTLMITGGVFIGLAVFGLIFLIYAIIKRKDKREFDQKLASWSGKLWIEVKVLLSLLVFGLMMILFNTPVNGTNPLNRITTLIVYSCALLILGWWFYLMLIDLVFNGRKFFTHNIVNSLLLWYQKTENMYPWQKSMIQRACLLVAAEAVLAPISVLFLINDHAGGGFLISVLIAAVGVYLIYRYLKAFKQMVADFGKLTDQIEVIKNGDMSTRLELAADSDMYRAAQSLNSIQEGMSMAVGEKTRSERMKMELITNVSHDLKTPLTSIISYIDLLRKEDGLPEHVNDYIQVLAQKSERLKNIIRDLFDLSKASSASIAVDMEKLDLGRLIRQTMAEMEEQVNASGLTFRVNVPDEPVYISSDGKKLCRVFENLISNALKYSLAGSRVFVDLVVEGNTALATIKNTSSYEMDFAEDEILQRFVRGDESRTSEGSGLGLSIAQSFTQICGGDFSIKIDGDLFKTALRFNTLAG